MNDTHYYVVTSSSWLLTSRDNESDNNSTTVARRGRPSDADYAWVWIYLSPVILVAGLVGNSLTIAVMARRRLRGTSTSVYLSAISLADSAALIFRIVPEFFEACELFTFSELNRLIQYLNRYTVMNSSDLATTVIP